MVHMNGRVYDPMLGRVGTPRSDDGEPILDARLEPLQLCRQLAAELRRSQWLLLPRLRLAKAVQSARSTAAEVSDYRSDHTDRSGCHLYRGNIRRLLPNRCSGIVRCRGNGSCQR